MINIKKAQSAIINNQNIILIGLAILVVILGLLILTTRQDGISSATSSDTDTNSQVSEEQVMGQQQGDQIVSDARSSTTTESEHNEAVDTDEDQQASVETVINKQEPYDVPLTAEAVFVWDMRNQQVLFERDPDTERPLASVTKLMTALVASEMVNLSEQEVTITRQHLEAYGNSGLAVNQTWALQDLISFMLMTSANDAARAVASASSTSESDGYYSKAFIEQMNQTAKDLGLESTYFFNPSGLDLNETLISGGYGTARDIAHLFAHIINTNLDILEPTTKSTQIFESRDGLVHTARNTNTWLSRFDNTLGSKTGYTVLAGGNLVMGFDLENPVVIVVMGSTRTGRFQDMQTLYNATQQHFKNNPQTVSTVENSVN